MMPSVIKDAPPQTLRQKLTAIWKASGEQPQELADHPAKPPHFEWIWEWFYDMPSPITWSEIQSWSYFSGIKPTRWEGRLLIELDYLRK